VLHMVVTSFSTDKKAITQLHTSGKDASLKHFEAHASQCLVHVVTCLQDLGLLPASVPSMSPKRAVHSRGQLLALARS
jgi:hypothetical protein